MQNKKNSYHSKIKKEINSCLVKSKILDRNHLKKPIKGESINLDLSKHNINKKILNNLNFSTSYNIAADSLRLNPIRMNAGTTILNNKLNLNIGATFDPYSINANGTRINKLNITNGGGLVRMTSANINLRL